MRHKTRVNLSLGRHPKPLCGRPPPRKDLLQLGTGLVACGHVSGLDLRPCRPRARRGAHTRSADDNPQTGGMAGLARSDQTSGRAAPSIAGRRFGGRARPVTLNGRCSPTGGWRRTFSGASQCTLAALPRAAVTRSSPDDPYRGRLSDGRSLPFSDAAKSSRRNSEVRLTHRRCMHRPITLPSSTLSAANKVVVPCRL